MTLADIISAAKFWDNPSGTTWSYAGNGVTPGPVSGPLKQTIISWITDLYASPYGRQLLEGAAAAGILNFGAANSYFAARDASDPWIGIDVQLTPLYYINEIGVKIPHNPIHILAHELSHLYQLGGTDDPGWPNTVETDAFMNALSDVKGEAVRVENLVANELGHTHEIRTSYFGSLVQNDPRFLLFDNGRSYTKGQVIDHVRIGDIPFQPLNNLIDTRNLGASRDLIFGLSGDDVILSGDGADWIYGGDGNDTIDGGDGYDRAVYDFGSFGVSIDIRPGTDAFHLKYGAYEDTLSNVELVELTDFSDTVYINGIVANFGSERPTIALGAATDTFGADAVDATDADTGIYFNVGSGNIVGLDQATERGSWFGAASWLPTLLGASLGPTDLQITGAEEVFGSDYSDALIASSYSKTDLYGGNGNDFLFGRGPLANLWGEGGADVFHIGSNTVIKDAETTGDSVWMGLPIFGGTKQWWMEGNKAYWSPFSTITTAFPVIGAEILATASFFVDVVTMKFASFQSYEDGGLGINIGYGLGGVAKIENYELDFDTGRASGGVVVFSATRAGDASSGFQKPNQEKFIQFINLALKAGFGIGFTGWDPIVLDLDGDGYELTTQRNSGVHFEFDGDGFAEKTGWVRPDDGFLVLDANGNGIVDDASEFFGDETQGGFVELATHDLNLDGVIDSLDAVFADLRVWRDLNSDGVTDNGELFDLDDLGIVSISLAAVAPEEGINIGGNVVAFESTFTLADGTVRKAGDVVLDISHIDTRYITDTVVSSAAAALPQLRGFGNVADLHVAMSEDAALLAQVQAFDALATSDLPVLKQAAEAIIYAWANVDGVATDPIGANGFDARKLAFLEAFSGQEIAPRDPVTGAVSTAGLAELEASWTDTLESLTLRLVVQSSSLPAFANMTYREDLDLIVMGGADTLKQAYSAILTGLSSDPATALGEWEAWGELLRAVQDGSRRFDNNIVRDDFAAAQLLAAIAETGTSFDLTTLARALGITNLRLGTAGSDTLTNVSGGTIFAGLGDGDTAIGRGGQDVYLLESGFGDVVIDDEEGVQSCSANPDRVLGLHSSMATCSPLLRAWRMRRAMLRSGKSRAGQRWGLSAWR